MSDCKKLYNDSIVKKVIDNWVLIELNEDDLVSVDGKKAGLLSLDILLSNFGFEEYNETGYYYGKYYPTGDIPGWLYSTSPFWIDSNEGDNNYNYALDNQKYVVWNYAFNKRSIRPVIYLKKSIIGDNDNYNIGDKVTYKREDYYVVDNSDSNKDYVMLLKEQPLTYKQIDNYSKLNYDDYYNELLDKLYNIQYYSSETCSKYNGAGCKNDYENSKVKKVIDKWLKDKDIEKDLVKVNGYKSRLLNANDLFDSLNYNEELYHNYTGNKKIYVVNNDVPRFIYNLETKYWTMIGEESGYYDYSGQYQVSANSVYTILENGYFGSEYMESYGTNNIYVYNAYAIRPVLNLNKCAIDGECITEEIEIEDGCLEDIENVVDVPSTISFISKIVLIISLMFIIGGFGYLSLNYYKSRKERK